MPPYHIYHGRHVGGRQTVDTRHAYAIDMGMLDPALDPAHMGMLDGADAYGMHPCIHLSYIHPSICVLRRMHVSLSSCHL